MLGIGETQPLLCHTEATDLYKMRIQPRYSAKSTRRVVCTDRSKPRSSHNEVRPKEAATGYYVNQNQDSVVSKFNLISEDDDHFLAGKQDTYNLLLQGKKFLESSYSPT